jgi:hypothetical protein
LKTSSRDEIGACPTFRVSPHTDARNLYVDSTVSSAGSHWSPECLISLIPRNDSENHHLNRDRSMTYHQGECSYGRSEEEEVIQEAESACSQ